MTSSDTLATRMAFVGIDETTRNLLREVRPMAMATLPAVLDKFYQTIAKFPDVQRMFPRPEIVAHAKAAQLAHWDMILSARFDADYVRTVSALSHAGTSAATNSSSAASSQRSKPALPRALPARPSSKRKPR